MLECSQCGEIISEFRPKFFMILEKLDPMPANVKKIICPKCQGINYAINLEYCSQSCAHYNPLVNPMNPREILNIGCRGQCMAEFQGL